MIDPNDGGTASRKLRMSYVVMLLGSAGWLLTGYKPNLATSYFDYCIFLLSSATIYIGGNVGTKWLAATKGTPKAKPADAK